MFLDFLLAGVISSGLTLFVDRIINPHFGDVPVSNFYVDMYRSTDDLNDILKSCMDLQDEQEKKQKGPSDEQV
ncbi:hypothetical protein [Solobacterium sp.]|uniref:hypothetical protein n=1 Tax=Solobacterium sp. TaxID=2060878 RepID=UPI001CB4FB4A|nr:hypothetical protein [Solobacterium sp.]MBF1085242.1 hypothetical protein [Solobacterium sp.]